MKFKIFINGKFRFEIQPMYVFKTIDYYPFSCSCLCILLLLQTIGHFFPHLKNWFYKKGRPLDHLRPITFRHTFFNTDLNKQPQTFYHLKFILCYAGQLLFLLLQLLQRFWDSGVWLQERHPSPKFYFSYLSYYLYCHWFLENQWAVPNKKAKHLKKHLNNHLYNTLLKNSR